MDFTFQDDQYAMSLSMDYRIDFLDGSSPIYPPRPDDLPKAGDILCFTEHYETPGMMVYQAGDELHLMKRTTEAPYGKISSLGNWLVITKHGISVWSNIEWLMAEEKIGYFEDHIGALT